MQSRGAKETCQDLNPESQRTGSLFFESPSFLPSGSEATLARLRRYYFLIGWFFALASALEDRRRLLSLALGWAVNTNAPDSPTKTLQAAPQESFLSRHSLPSSLASLDQTGQSHHRPQPYTLPSPATVEWRPGGPGAHGRGLNTSFSPGLQQPKKSVLAASQTDKIPTSA